jgi:predicted NUDIX family NTP pyrophosphohydrolase
MENRKAQQNSRKLAGPGAAFQRKDDDFTKDAKKFKKFVEASRAAKVETAKDKVSPMKAQRHFMDTSKYRQKENVKKKEI